MRFLGRSVGPCTNYITLKGGGGVEVPLYSVILEGWRFAHELYDSRQLRMSSEWQSEFSPCGKRFRCSATFRFDVLTCVRLILVMLHYVQHCLQTYFLLWRSGATLRLLPTVISLSLFTFSV